MSPVVVVEHKKEKRQSLDNLLGGWRHRRQDSPIPARLNRQDDKGKQKENSWLKKKLGADKRKQKEVLDEADDSATDNSTDFSGDYVQDMVFTTEVSEDSPSIESMLEGAEKENVADKSDLYYGLREYVTESVLQLRGETDESDSYDSDETGESSSFSSSLDETSTSINDSSSSDGSSSPYRSTRPEDLPTDYREIDFTELILQERVGKHKSCCPTLSFLHIVSTHTTTFQGLDPLRVYGR